MSISKRSVGIAASLSTVGASLNNAGVTIFTRLSVHCADKITATINSYGELKCNSLLASGKSFESISKIAFVSVTSVCSSKREGYNNSADLIEFNRIYYTPNAVNFQEFALYSQTSKRTAAVCVFVEKKSDKAFAA